MAKERRLEARDVEAIFREFAMVVSELPPDTEAGWLDAEGDLRLTVGCEDAGDLIADLERALR